MLLEVLICSLILAYKLDMKDKEFHWKYKDKHRQHQDDDHRWVIFESMGKCLTESSTWFIHGNKDNMRNCKGKVADLKSV